MLAPALASVPVVRFLLPPPGRAPVLREPSSFESLLGAMGWDAGRGQPRMPSFTISAA